MRHKRHTIVKEFFREIFYSRSRFISIFLIISVGVASYAGLRTTGIDMKETADKYFDDQKYTDISIQSSLGLTEADVNALMETDGVKMAEGTWTIDAYLYSDDDYIVKVHTLNGQTSHPVLMEGRLPEDPTECLVGTAALLLFNIKIGDTITLKTEEGLYQDSLRYEEFTIVGTVDSANYISISRGTSSLGNGVVLDYVYLQSDAFNFDYYTDINVLVEGAAELQSFSDEYTELISSEISVIEELGEVQTVIRYDEIIDEAEAELDEAKQKYADAEADAEQQLADAWTEIEDAQQEIKEAEESVAKGEAELKSSTADAQAELDSAYKELKASEEEIAAKEREISSAKTQLQQGQADLAASQEQANQAIAENEANLAAAQAELEASGAALEESKVQLDEMEAQIAMMKSTGGNTIAIASMEEEYRNYKAQYDEGLSQYEAAAAEIESGKKTLEAEKISAQEQLDTANAELEASRAQIETGEKEIAAAKTQVEEGWTDYNQGKAELEESSKAAQEEIDAANADLEEARLRLTEGQENYAQAEADAEEELAAAEEEIRNAEDNVNSITTGQWYVNNRSNNTGYSSFVDDADRMTALASVFPIIFFLVAALVSLTTMTRMVESKRIEIGTMHAMGYSKLSIAMIYVMYGFLASLGGSISGFFVGIHLIPTIIYGAYTDLLYTLPELIIPIRLEYLVSSILIAEVCVIGATIWACYSSFMETAAALMKPKAPKPGKRIFLERITFLWRPLPYIYKVTARNILRYKKRFIMTLIGICGCTGLLISGFGLRESMMSVVGIQYNELVTYDMVVSMTDTSAESYKEDVNAYLDGEELAESSTWYRMINSTAYTNERSVGVYGYVPMDVDAISEYYVLRDNATKKEIPLTDDGVVITKKLSELLDIQAGGKITFSLEGYTVTADITGIAECYVYNYIFITPALYEELVGNPPVSNALYVNLIDDSAYDEVAENVLSIRGVSSVYAMNDLVDLLERSMQSIDAAVLVIIVSAAILAFIVLYNLNNINIAERIRELSTIKVVGFYDLEVTLYIFRENVVLTLLGILMLGQIFGTYLHRYLVGTVEIEIMMFARSATIKSYIYSIALTLLFSLLVNVYVHFRLKVINMVEAVKMPD